MTTKRQESGDNLIYNLNDIYYINRAVDLWLYAQEDCPADEDENDANERGMTDD